MPARDTLPTDPGYGRGRMPTRDDMRAQGRYGYQDRTADIESHLGRLQQQALGQGPSIAGLQLQQGLSQALNQQQSLAASGRPGMGGLAQRMAMQNNSRMAADTNQQAAMARMQEQQMAQGQLAQLLQQQQAQHAQMAFLEKNQGMGAGGVIGRVGGGIVGGLMGGPQGAYAGMQAGGRLGDQF